MKRPESYTTDWLIGPDKLSVCLRWVFNASLTIVAVWFVAQTIYWIVFGAINPGPLPDVMHIAFLVGMSAWGTAIAIKALDRVVSRLQAAKLVVTDGNGKQISFASLKTPGREMRAKGVADDPLRNSEHVE